MYPHASDDRFLFLSSGDRLRFLELVDETFAKLDLAVLSYTLMGTHYHLLVYTPDERLSSALQRVHTEYSRAHNAATRHSAHLFRAHCRARRVHDDLDVLATHRYLALNPVAAALVDEPLSWPWSSARAHAGVERPRIALYESPLRDALGGGADWRSRYARLVALDEPATPSP